MTDPSSPDIGPPDLPGIMFELIRTVEFDLQVGGDTVQIRLELFQASTQEDLFRCRLWQRETFRLTPTFPQDSEDQPTDATDDDLLTERSHLYLDETYESFRAMDAETALRVVLEDLTSRLGFMTDRRPNLSGGASD